MKEIIHTLGLVLCFILLFLCFNVLNHKIETIQTYNNNQYNTIITQIDSLENEFNIHKVQKDTITLNIINHEN